MTQISAHTKAEYTHFFELSTRWMDNDVYGHVNNVVYYSYFDTIVNQYLIEHGDFDIHRSDYIGLMVHSECNYLASIAFPDKIHGAFRVNRIGNSSVQYGVAVFANDSNTACAQASLTHVFVQRTTQKPVLINGEIRAALERAIR